MAGMQLRDHESSWLLFAPGGLAGRTAVVTGGGTGIGRATVRLLAHLGVRTAVVGRRAEPLAELVDEITADGGPAPVAVPADLRDPELVTGLVPELLAALDGRVDYLVNNAGGQFLAPAESISYHGFRAVARLNLDATWLLTTLLARHAFLPAGYGKVVSITMTPRRGMPGMAHSSAARAAVESLTRTWAAEWAQHGVRTVAVAPGIVQTQGWSKNYGLDPAVVADALPAGRLQAPEEIAAVVAFLLSPLGDPITGETVVVDDGYSGLGPAAVLQAALTAAHRG
jgi:citronellol/citronellal dehydrogenase